MNRKYWTSVQTLLRVNVGPGQSDQPNTPDGTLVRDACFVVYSTSSDKPSSRKRWTSESGSMIFGTHGWCDNEGRQVDGAERGNYILPQSGIVCRTVREGSLQGWAYRSQGDTRGSHTEISPCHRRETTCTNLVCQKALGYLVMKNLIRNYFESD